jgi:hypothetical protein
MSKYITVTFQDYRKPDMAYVTDTWVYSVTLVCENYETSND